MSKKHRVLITGSNGLLGQKLVALLYNKSNVELLATARGSKRLEDFKKLQYQEMDICNLEEVLRIVGEFSPTSIINTAAFTQVDDCEKHLDECERINVLGVQNLIDASVKNGCKLIHLSTDFVFDGKKGNYNEEDKPNPLSAYAKSKLDAEILIENSELQDWIIARTIIIYGITKNMSRSNLVLWAYNSLLNKKTITVVDDQYRSPTLAEDLAEACWLMVDKNAKGIYHISGPETYSVLELVHQIAEYFKLDKNLIKPISTASLNQLANRPPHTGFDISKAQNDLDYHPRTFKEGLAIVEAQMKQ